MPSQTAAQARAHLAERQVDLVVHHEHALQRQLQRAARRTHGAPSVVHERLRAEHRNPRAAGTLPLAGACACVWRDGRCLRRRHATFGQATAEAVLGPTQVPALDQRLRNHETDVVASARVLAAGITQSDDQPVDLGAKHHLIVREPDRRGGR